MIIKEVLARKIKDSNSKETIEVSVNKCKASSPSGKSTGKYETSCYKESLDWNIDAINKFEGLKGIEINNFQDMEKIEILIKSKFKFKDAKQFGANALFALESSILKALAKSKKKQLWQIINPDAKKMPIPVGNCVGGGLHARTKNAPVFQEFLLIPKSLSIEENVKTINEIYNNLQMLLNSNSKDDEGAWETTLTNDEVLEILSRFREKTNLGVDIAASSFYKDKSYKYYRISLSRAQQISYINSIIEKYDLLYVEDPLDEEDFSGFSEIIKKNLIAGDDLTATHLERLKKAIENNSINAAIIKPNQNGSLLELKEIIDFCKKNNIKTIISHRAGETLDTALADYAFGFQADYIKCGISTKWREAKLNRLIEIEKSLK